MTRQFKRTVVLAAVALGLGTGSALASELVVARVPFPFLVNNRMLPAGRYEIRTDEQNPGVLEIVGVHGTKGVAVVNTIPEYGQASTGGQAALTFVRHENQYRLSEVWESSDYARELPQR